MNISEIVKNIELSLISKFEEIDAIAEFCQEKILRAMQFHKLSDEHFAWHTGYGYDDKGREITEKIYASVFGTEDALVRPTIVSGTHALSLMLNGLLKQGDTLVSITGKPYDTLEQVIGIGEKKSKSRSLIDNGVLYSQIDLLDNGDFDFENIQKILIQKPEYIYIQRSSGYSLRKAISIADIKNICKLTKEISPTTTILCDNCYGEFLDKFEPTEVGVDVVAGSLIKNPGGGLALSGGYVCGSADRIELISERLTAAGIGKECGLTFGQTRNILQGLFIAPSVVSNAIKGAMLFAGVYKKLGYFVSPDVDAPRSDIIQAIKFGSSEKVIAFCQGIQKASPVGSHVTTLPWEMPGYSDPVIMASGAFVMGSSIELSADAPIREPFVAYYQGGLTYAHTKLALKYSLESLNELL